MHPLPFDPIIADAYRQAALDSRDMYVFAGQMERLKTALAPAKDLYQQWDRLDDLIGEALWTAQDAHHLLWCAACSAKRWKCIFRRAKFDVTSKSNSKFELQSSTSGCGVAN